MDGKRKTRPTSQDLKGRLEDAARRWRAAERDPSAAAVRSALSGRPEALVAWLWLAPSLIRPEQRARVERRSTGSTTRKS